LKLTIAICITLILAGCCGTKEIITKTDTLYVPYAIDTSMTLVRSDTIWIAGRDRIIVKVDTTWKKVWVKIRDTVSITHTDTVQNYIGHTQSEVDAEFKNGFKWGSGSTIALFAALMLGFFLLKSKLGFLTKLIGL
jgi:hypothetical protein